LLLKADKYKPNYWNIQFNLATVAQGEGNKEQERKYINRTLELSPNYQPAIDLLEELNK